MNLIVNRPLGQAEKQLIYELTLKKRKSKKSTMSEKQLLAKQQLARELLPHQRMGPMDSLDSLNTTRATLFMASTDDDQQQQLVDEQGGLLARCLGLGSTTSSSSNSGGGGSCGGDVGSGSISSTSAISSSSGGSSHSNSNGGLAGNFHQASKSSANCDVGINLISSSLGSSSCSFSRSDSSYSGSSQDSGAQMGAADELSRWTELELEARRKETRRKEANIKCKKSKLEHLNDELERRLYQYEYLVAQEKALLGTYNMLLFTNEGVNNFHSIY